MSNNEILYALKLKKYVFNKIQLYEKKTFFKPSTFAFLPFLCKKWDIRSQSHVGTLVSSYKCLLYVEITEYNSKYSDLRLDKAEKKLENNKNLPEKGTLALAISYDL